MDDPITVETEDFDEAKFQKNLEENNFDTVESEGKGEDR